MAGLVTLSDVRAHLNLPSADTSQDTELQGFIDAASEFITYLVGPVSAVSFTETYRVRGADCLVLRHVPVLSITTVTEYAGLVAYPLTAQPLGATVNNFGFTLEDAASGLLVRRSAAGTRMPFLGPEVVVSYTAGRSAVPAQVRMATLEDIRGIYSMTQLGSNRPAFGGGSDAADTWTVGPTRLFPRLAALMDGPGRTPSIA